VALLARLGEEGHAKGLPTIAITPAAIDLFRRSQGRMRARPGAVSSEVDWTDGSREASMDAAMLRVATSPVRIDGWPQPWKEPYECLVVASRGYVEVPDRETLDLHVRYDERVEISAHSP
jgi:hypothetical protein